MTQFDSPSRELIEKSFQANDDALLTAMAAAFGLVACSDAVLEHCEAVRFFEIIRASDSLSQLPWDQIEGRFTCVTENILQKNEKGRENALALVAKIKANDAYRDAVIACARIAVIANFKIQEVEERALGEICGALGINPNDI